MDNPINLDNILEQAPRWTFSGDFTLLQWMKQISKGLESRATKTSEALVKLDSNVKATNIALDNVANRLTTLQFGNQFVEYRVQDDDETFVKANEASRDNHDRSEQSTSKELLNTFLDNNLKVLRNCHEKYSIDLEDSDEENSCEKTCIYQPINPYNDRPLPYIFGSKDWNSKWHVGLCENQQENSYSGDEIFEAFSESSSTSHVDDNESFESNTEWASSNSIDNDNLTANIEVKNASSLRGSQPLYPGTPLPINAAKSKTTISESSSISTTSSSLAKKPLQSTKQNENLTQRLESINSTSPKNSSKTNAKILSDNRVNVLQQKTHTQQFVDLFAEPTQYQESKTSLSVSSASNIIKALEDNGADKKEEPSAFKTQPPPFVDLFAEPPEDLSSATSSMLSNQNLKRKTVNLFDDDEDKISNYDFLPVLTIDKELQKAKTKEKSIASNKHSSVVKTSKPLFDDSDEDDDFLKAFVKKSCSNEASKRSLTETQLFDNKIHEPAINSILLSTDTVNGNNTSNFNTTSKKTYSTNKRQNIFDDNEDDLLFNKPKIEETKKPIPNPKLDGVLQLAKTSVPVTNLLNKPVVKEHLKKSLNELNDSHKIITKINLFDDLDEEDNIFSISPKKNEGKDAVEESEEKSTAAKEVDANKVSNNQLEVSNSLHNEKHNMSKEVFRKEDNIPQTISSEITENKVHTESIAKDKLFGRTTHEKYTQPQKQLNDNSAPLIRDILVSVPTNVTEKPSSSNKYDVNSVLFLDEPPEDDDEVFETLTKTPSTLNSNYNVIDLENYIYEPELPKVPAASTSNNQTDTTDNFYTGLQLFSDIPPDDDAGGSDISNLVSDVNQPKRLHSVFYDDFNETLMALNQQHTGKETPKHHIFNDEPPPMKQILNSSSEIDHKVPDNKQEIVNTDHKRKSLEADDQNTSEFCNKRPVSKLQMPNININIQALLPGANTLRKTEKDNLKSIVVNPCNDDMIPGLNVVKSFEVTISKTHLREAPRTAETEHILPNVTKNRVRASATRRPSTRRARQENYLKSLMEEQSWENRDEKCEIQNENNNIFKAIKTDTKSTIPQTSVVQQKPTNAMEVGKQYPKDKINDKMKRNNSSKLAPISSTSKLFEDKHQDSFKTLQDTNTKNNDGSLNNFNEIKAKTKTKQETDLLFFGDEEDDDDFFKHIKTSNILDSNRIIKANESSENISAKSPETSEANNSSPSIILANNTNITKVFLESPSLGAAIAYEVSPSTANEYETKPPTRFIETAKLTTANQSNINPSKSFLDSEDDDNDLFKTTLQRATSSTRKKDKNNKAKSQFKSFLDSETDEDSNVARLQTTTSTHSLKISSKEEPNVFVRTRKNINAKLFSDSETDSDDFFGKLSSTTISKNKISVESISKTQTKTQPQSSLFDSCESDGDDFIASSGSVSKKTESKTALKKNVPKSVTQTSASLFSDLDSDEDDLFGGTAAKVTTRNATNIKNVKAPLTAKPTASVAEISKSKRTDDNPLADLL